MLNVFFSLFLVGLLLSFNHSDRVVLSNMVFNKCAILRSDKVFRLTRVCNSLVHHVTQSFSFNFGQVEYI